LRLAPETITELMNRPWPGNVRELRNAVEHAAILARGGEVRCEHLPESVPLSIPGGGSLADRIHRALAEWTSTVELENSEDPLLYERFLQLVEPPLLEAILKRCGQNRAAAAQLLGLHRATFRQKLKRHGVG